MSAVLAIGMTGSFSAAGATSAVANPPSSSMQVRSVAPVPIVLGPSPAVPTRVVETPHLRAGGIQAQSTTSTFIVNYDAGFNANPAAKAAFQFAVDQWSNLITSSVPIVVDASFTELPPGVLGSAGPVNLYRNFPGAPQTSTWYPVALANSLNGSDLQPSVSDIGATFASTFPSFYFGTDGNTAGKLDFASVVLHELGHGLGFLGLMDVDGFGVGSCCFATTSPSIYDRFTTTNGTSLLSIPDNTVALGNALQGQDLRFTGPQAAAANGGTPPRLYGPSPWESGSSYAHLDESTYGAGNPNSLMTPAIGFNEVIHTPGAITLGLFADSGWSVGALPKLSIGSARIVEGNSSARNVRFNVALSNPVAFPVTAHYTTVPGTATAPADFAAKAGTLTIPAGMTATSVTVAVRGDTIVEGDQKFSIKMSAPTGAVFGRRTATATITNDEPSSGVQVSMGNVSIEEGNVGNRALKFAVTLSAKSANAVSIDWTTGVGTATAGGDYTARFGTLVIPAGSTGGTISITVNTDATVEGPENFPVTISNPSGAGIYRANGFGTINDDD